MHAVVAAERPPSSITFGIVAFTLIIQALSIDFVVERSLGASMRDANPEPPTRI